MVTSTGVVLTAAESVGGEWVGDTVVGDTVGDAVGGVGETISTSPIRYLASSASAKAPWFLSSS